MGVPKFYRWLSERYPQINQIISGIEILPEFDNLYLDMNGIIHACTHANNDNTITNNLTIRDMVLAIFRYIDHIVTEIVKPKKILFLAIDGVAPRAKLNQQRARRFRSAQELQENINKLILKGEVINTDNLFDSNCITPGTEFMEIINKNLKYFIRKKIKEDPLWQNLTIYYSGHDVPGEGEHKIMSFIRDLRNNDNYEPNVRHCMYGQDADLIMLGLVTHECHFSLLREIVKFNTFNNNNKIKKEDLLKQTKNNEFQLLHLSILRQYISLDIAYGCPWTPDPERLIDDFVLLTFLVGNDFLPHLPTLDISEHAFDILINIYKNILFNNEPGYIVKNGEINDFSRLEMVFNEIGKNEYNILKTRENELKQYNDKRRKYNNNILSEEELEEEEDILQKAFEAALQIAIENDDNNDDIIIQSSLEAMNIDPSLSMQHTLDWQVINSNNKPQYANKKIKKNKQNKNDNNNEEEVTKDYRGRYYYEKFKILVNTMSGQTFMRELMINYLQGLMWVLAYYTKGCVSWTWYYPYHYGPMLIDMTNIEQLSDEITFDLGQPFLPFQQLLGCLPPASSKFLPRPYQWLMLSDESPIKHFYPLDFNIDQDGKKNPWEAVILLDFINEKELINAETLHCTVTKLTKNELNRNVFGTILIFYYNPSITDTYISNSIDIGLQDIHSCQSIMLEENFTLKPGNYFKPEQIPGTIMPIAGFPSLTTLPLNNIRTEAIKVNMFGSESRYQSLILEINSPDIYSLEKLDMELLLGKIVYVNYPMIHEAKVVAVSTENEMVRIVYNNNDDNNSNNNSNKNGSYVMNNQSTLDAIKNVGKNNKKKIIKNNNITTTSNNNNENTIEETTIIRKKFNDYESDEWLNESEEESAKYLTGRGIPGTGGLDIGTIRMRLRVLPLQGLRRDPVTGACTKIYSSTEADIPIQMAIWTPPVMDTRFEETEALPVEQLMPYNAEVIALVGQLMGCKGRVIGPHGPDSVTNSINDNNKDNNKKRRVVDVEIMVTPPEPPFGYSIANSIQDEYYSTRDLCALLQVTPSVLGKIVGSIRVEPGRADLGLNLKRNGLYQLLGYAKRVENNNNADNQSRKIWGGVDSVEVIGMVSNNNNDGLDEAEGSYWQYSARAAALIFDYKTNFPILFAQLERLDHQFVYKPSELLGPNNAEKKLEVVLDWLKSQPFYKLPRTPFTTVSLSREAMSAIERAADVHVSSQASKEQAMVVVKGVPVESLFCNAHRSVTDVPLTYNILEPKLGDRVVNLTCSGVPFGFRGTVITIHAATKYVEVIFDEEFMGGKGLQGSCSQFRGRLCPWADLLLVSRQNEYKEFKKSGKTKNAKNDISYSASVTKATPSKQETGKKLLSILQKPSDTSRKASSSSKDTEKAVDLLRQKMGIGKQGNSTTATSANVAAVANAEAKEVVDAVSSSIVQSNGTGTKVLAEAAGFSPSDACNDTTLLPPSDQAALLHQNPLLGVISYQPVPAVFTQRGPTGMVFASQPHYSSSNNQERPQYNRRNISPPRNNAGPRTTINKDASQRMIKHELRPNKELDKRSTPIINNLGTPIAPPARSITAILSAAKNKGNQPNTKSTTTTTTDNNKAIRKDNTEKSPIKETKISNTNEGDTPKEGKSISAMLANAKKAMKEKQAKTKKDSEQRNSGNTSDPVSITQQQTVINKPNTGTNEATKGTNSTSIVDILSKAKAKAVRTTPEATNTTNHINDEVKDTKKTGDKSHKIKQSKKVTNKPNIPSDVKPKAVSSIVPSKVLFNKK